MLGFEARIDAGNVVAQRAEGLALRRQCCSRRIRKTPSGDPDRPPGWNRIFGESPPIAKAISTDGNSA